MKAAHLNSTDKTGKTTRVWDPLVRIFHWSLVIAFFSAYALGDDGGQLHQALGAIQCLGWWPSVWRGGWSAAATRAFPASFHRTVN